MTFRNVLRKVFEGVRRQRQSSEEEVTSSGTADTAAK